ncbi:DUF4446 family protein [Stomatohabitans albus]|uniref:DUF4446 family protein n=1 Tax=Stomatohabitans albus TaxID=3110766 RepID=UPI00300C638C
MDQTTLILLVISILLSVASLAMALKAIKGEQRIKAAYRRFSKGRKEDVITLLDAHITEVEALRDEVAGMSAENRQLRSLISKTLSRVGVVRYDAFDDMGGRLSFSAALLDEHGDGIVVTAMNGRQQTRTYAKPVRAGGSSHHLSREEGAAIDQAMNTGRNRTKQALGPSGSSTQVAVSRADRTAETEAPRDLNDTGDYIEVLDHNTPAPHRAAPMAGYGDDDELDGTPQG